MYVLLMGLHLKVKLKEGLFKMAKDDKSWMKKVLEYVDPSLKNGVVNQSERDITDAKKITMPAYKVQNSKEVAPSDIADTLQDAKNQKGAADYEKNKTYKKGGKVTAKCMARGGGIEIRGKTRGRII